MKKDLELAARLDAIGKKIAMAKEKFQHHSILDQGHKITQSELDDRYNSLTRQLNEEVIPLEAAHKHVGKLEKLVLRWFNAIDQDFE